jgi:hypothetical protein
MASSTIESSATLKSKLLLGFIKFRLISKYKPKLIKHWHGVQPSASTKKGQAIKAQP